MTRFIGNPEEVRRNTNREGDGLGRTASPQSLGSGNPVPSYQVSVADKPGQSSDGTLAHAGSNAGVVNGVGSKPNDIQGFTSATGNKVIVDSSFGADSITIQHHTGATISIDSDGAIHLYSASKKGVGLISPRGDLTVFARNNLIIKGESRIVLESQGDVDLNVGGTLGLHVRGDMITNVQGSIHTSCDGVIITETSKDMSTVVAGDSRTTVAGNARIQSTGKLDIDAAKDLNIRSDANIVTQAQGDHSTRSKGKYKLSATGAISLNTSATTDILGGGAININGSSTSIQTSGSPEVDAAEKAQYAPANIIIDNLTSARVAPNFPGNAKRMSAEEFSTYKNEQQTPNPKAEAYAAGNKGGGAPVTLQSDGPIEPQKSDSYDLPKGVSNSNGKSEQNPLPLPTSIHNTSQKISRHFTVGHILNIARSPPQQHQAILKEAMNTAWNILDPLVEKYGSNFQITSWWRDNSPNHFSGGAVDMRAANKQDVRLTGEIAAFIRDNLPYKQLFLEKNDSPGIHLHTWAAPAGSGATGNVMTCADPGCRSKVAGLELSYAVAALKGGGGKVA